MCLAIPGQIKEIDDKGEFEKMGKVSFAGILKDVNLTFVPEAKVGDWCLVHTGMAISIISEEEAMETLKYFKEIEDLENEIYK